MTRAAENQPVDLLYIVGTGRCGTTFLDVMLGQQPGFWTLGELHLLKTWIDERDRCGCDATVPDCTFWQGVLAAVPIKTVEEVGRLRREPRPRGKALRWSFLLGNATARYGPEYAAANLSLMRAIESAAERVKGGPLTLIDASKDIYRLKMLLASMTQDRFRIRVIHLWRDAAGFVAHVANRWDLGAHHKSGLRKLVLVLRYALRWRIENRLFLRVVAAEGHLGDSMVVNFDDLMVDWHAGAAALCRRLGRDPEPAKFASTRCDINHGISGNAPRWSDLEPRHPAEPSFLASWEKAVVSFICGSTQKRLASVSETFP